MREIVGPDVLVCAELDPHSHLTGKRVAAADFFVVFKEFPHTDFVDRARGSVVASRCGTLRGEIKPVMSVFDCRMIDVFPTSQAADARLRRPADGAARRHDPDMLSISVIHGFMAGDVPEMGTKMLVVTDDAAAKGDALAERAGARAVRASAARSWCRRSTRGTRSRQALAAPRGPVVIADVWDNPGGGTAGDATVLLAELIGAGATDVAVGTIWDPIAVQICFAAGEGAEIPLRFGAKSAPETGDPIDESCDHRASSCAMPRCGSARACAPFGDAARIRFDGIEVILNSTRAQSFDPSLFRAMGIDPTTQKILVIKSTNHFYASFSKIAAEIIYCSAGRPYPNNAGDDAYRKARRDIWPMVDNPFG